MEPQGPAQRALSGGWRVALLSLLVLVLSVQPFMCLLHCAHEDLLRQRGAVHAYQMLCSTGDHPAGDMLAAASAWSTTASPSASILAYWLAMLSTWTVVLGTFAIVIRMLVDVFHCPAAFATAPVPPPPR